jgi:hypothetical protein
VGSSPSIAASNNCCALVFSWNSATKTLTKSNTSYTKFCDGLYEVRITAKNALVPTYSETFRANLKVKYDCAYLRAQYLYVTPTVSLTSTPGKLFLWPEGSPGAEFRSELVMYTKGNSATDITHPLIHTS